MLKIDHVVIAVDDLVRSSDELFERFGLGSVAGGRHDAWGTANRLVPIGDQYLELLAVEDPASQHPLATAVRDASADGDQLMAVCCEVDDIEAVADRLGTTVMPGHRQLPDGGNVSWQLTGLEGALTQALPFFIHWGAGREMRMGSEAVAHRIQPRAITRVDVGGDAATLEAWLGGGSPAINAVGGAPGVRAVVIDTADRELVLETPSQV
jgi:hypothetical protein